MTLDELVANFPGLGTWLLVMLVRQPPGAWPRAGAALALPPWWLSRLHGTADVGLLTTLLVYFAKAGAVVLGAAAAGLVVRDAHP